MKTIVIALIYFSMAATYVMAAVDTLVFTTHADGGDPDTYYLKPEAKKKTRLFLTGYVYNEETFDAVKANIRVEGVGNPVLKTGHSEPNYGEYRTQLPGSGIYILQVSAAGYLTTTDSIEVESILGDTEIIFKDLYLKPVEAELSARLHNIFFDSGKIALHPESIAELNRLVEFMEQNANLQIEIGGHADSRESNDLHQKLSQQRAAVVRNYLLHYGIEAKRLTTIGYGASRPKVLNDTIEGMQNNRRVEFTVLKTE